MDNLIRVKLTTKGIDILREYYYQLYINSTNLIQMHIRLNVDENNYIELYSEDFYKLFSCYLENSKIIIDIMKQSS